MNKVLLLFCVMGLRTATAIKPQRRPGFSAFRSSRQETDSTSTSYGPPAAETTTPPEAPYPPSGWTPNGDLLLVPGETHSSQQNTVDNTYGTPPDTEYGAPTTTTTTTPAPEIPDADSTNQQDRQLRHGNEAGQYYVLLPDGKLQRVKYFGKNKGRGQYEAQVQYEVVDPIQPPIYTYQGVPVSYT